MLKCFEYLIISIWEHVGGIVGLLALAGAMLVIAGAVLIRREEQARGGVMLIAGVAIMAVRLVIGNAELTTGVITAWPVAVAGIILGWNDDRTHRFLAVTCGLFAIAVLATQHPDGGGLEWGGRYFSPALVAVAVMSSGGVARLRLTQMSDKEQQRAYRLLADTAGSPLQRLRWLAPLRAKAVAAGDLDAVAGLDRELDVLLESMPVEDLERASGKLDGQIPAARAQLVLAERALDARRHDDHAVQGDLAARPHPQLSARVCGELAAHRRAL